MKAPKQEGNYDFAICPEGVHVARLFKIIYIGTVENEYNGQKYWAPMVKLHWELPNEPLKYKDKDGKEVESVFTISKELTLSMSGKANLRKLVEGMLGKSMTDDEAFEFDIDDLMGKTCMLNIIHKKSKDGEKTFAVINSAMPLMKGVEVPEQVFSPKIINVMTCDESDIDELYEKLRDKMKSSKEWQERVAQKTVDNWYPSHEGGTAFDQPDDKLPN